MPDMDLLTTPPWRDAHLHLRQGYMTKPLARFTGGYCTEAVVMPNTVPAVETADHVRTYLSFCKQWLWPVDALRLCQPLMTIKLTKKTTPDIVREAKAVGAVAIKVYPEGVTTNSGHGTSAPSEYTVPLWEPFSGPEDVITREMLLNPTRQMIEVLEAAEDYGMIVLWHGELPGSFVMDREHDFLKVFESMARRFPRLRMVLEHITTEAAVNMVDLLYHDGFKVAATVTMHHLWMKNGLDDVMGGMLRPDRFCKPVAKRPGDHKALVRAVRMPNVFLGTDSAAHSLKDKYAAQCCAGCFTANTPEMLVQLFDDWGILGDLIYFTSERMAAFYGIPSTPGMPKLYFRRKEWEVPREIDVPGFDTIVPFLAGETLRWKLEHVR